MREKICIVIPFDKKIERKIWPLLFRVIHAPKPKPNCIVVDADGRCSAAGFETLEPLGVNPYARRPFAIHQFSSAVGVDEKVADIESADSVEVGKRALAWILAPIRVHDFFSLVFERRALVIQRRAAVTESPSNSGHCEYFTGLFGTTAFMDILQKVINTMDIIIDTYRPCRSISSTPPT